MCIFTGDVAEIPHSLRPQLFTENIIYVGYQNNVEFMATRAGSQNP